MMSFEKFAILSLKRLDQFISAGEEIGRHDDELENLKSYKQAIELLLNSYHDGSELAIIEVLDYLNKLNTRTYNYKGKKYDVKVFDNFYAAGFSKVTNQYLNFSVEHLALNCATSFLICINNVMFEELIILKDFSFRAFKQALTARIRHKIEFLTDSTNKFFFVPPKLTEYLLFHLNDHVMLTSVEQVRKSIIDELKAINYQPLPKDDEIIKFMCKPIKEKQS